MRDGTFSVDGAVVGSEGWPSGRSDGLAHGPSVRWRGSDDQIATPSGVRPDPAASAGEGASSGWQASCLPARGEAVVLPSGAISRPSDCETVWPSGRDVERSGRSNPAPIVRPGCRTKSSDIVCARGDAIRTSRLSADTVDCDALGRGGWLFGRRSIGSGTLRNAAPSGAAGRRPAGTSRGVVAGSFRNPNGKQRSQRAVDDPERRRHEATVS